jgi:hypothetical protein
VRPSAVPAARSGPGRWLWLLAILPLIALAGIGFVRVRARAHAVAAAAVAVATKGAETSPAPSATPSTQGALSEVTSTAENSAAAVLTLPSATPSRKAGPPARVATPGLSKKPNERYGRFE